MVQTGPQSDFKTVVGNDGVARPMIPWFEEDGKTRTIVVGDLNARQQESHILALAHGFRDEGITAGHAAMPVPHTVSL